MSSSILATRSRVRTSRIASATTCLCGIARRDGRDALLPLAVAVLVHEALLQLIAKGDLAVRIRLVGVGIQRLSLQRPVIDGSYRGAKVGKVHLVARQIIVPRLLVHVVIVKTRLARDRLVVAAIRNLRSASYRVWDFVTRLPRDGSYRASA